MRENSQSLGWTTENDKNKTINSIKNTTEKQKIKKYLLGGYVFSFLILFFFIFLLILKKWRYFKFVTWIWLLLMDLFLLKSGILLLSLFAYVIKWKFKNVYTRRLMYWLIFIIIYIPKLYGNILLLKNNFANSETLAELSSEVSMSFIKFIWERSNQEYHVGKE